MLQTIVALKDLTSGQIRLDGADIKGFDPGQLRQSVSYVAESPEFLDTTIARNLRLSNPLATDGELHEACALAGVLDDVQSLEIGQGRERQFGFEVEIMQLPREAHMDFLKRLSLARGYLRPSNVVLLDNPDRYLTPDGQKDLMRAVESLRDEKTVIISTDKPSLIRLADKVIWLDNGRVRAAGLSEEVLEDLYNAGQVGQTMEAS